MPCQSLGRLGRHVRPAEISDEGVQHGVEVGVEAFGGLVSQEVGLLAATAFIFYLVLINGKAKKCQINHHALDTGRGALC